MIKMVVLLKRREGMSFDDFVDYYEKHHAVLGRKIMATAVRYQRRFLRPLGGVVPGVTQATTYDCITELWFEDRADFDAAMACAAEPVNAAALVEDEAKLFDRSMISTYLIEDERQSQ